MPSLEEKRTKHRKVLKLLQRNQLVKGQRCAYCAPGKGCNSAIKRRPRSDKHKNHRRK
jgi:hypothetical protein